MAQPEELWLVVYLIDTVAGRILHRMTHHGSQGPVHAVLSENWVVYHYFNLKHTDMRCQSWRSMISLEWTTRMSGS